MPRWRRYFGFAAVASLVVGGSLASGLSAGASASTASPATAASKTAARRLPKGAVVVSAFHSRYGRVLVTGGGMAGAGMPLYVFSGDAFPFSTSNASKFQLDCTALNTAANGTPCTTPWVPLAASGPLVARRGVRQGALGTVTRDGVTQVTYHGRPLYTFVKDTAYHPVGEDVTAFKGVFWLDSPTGAPDAGQAKVGLQVSPAGTVLSTPTANGTRSVYQLTFDPNRDTTCISSCTAIWPPLLSTRRPIAMAGTDQHLLGLIRRPDGARQVTYKGRPLYMFAFDLAPGAPSGLTNGEDFADNLAHGMWYTMSPQGTPDAATAMIETETAATATLLAYKSGFTGSAVTLFTYSADTSTKSACLGVCARYWPPVLTTTAPSAGSGVTSAGLGEIQRPDGTFQVTYDGHPLYFFSQNLTSATTGAGTTFPGGGTFEPISSAGVVQ